MNKKILQEVEAIQNPALGAIIIWKFSKGYSKANADPLPIHLLFLAIPLLMCEDLFEVTKSSTRGLYKLRDNLSKKDLNTDHLFLPELQNRICDFKEITANSLTLALSCQLLELDYSSATASYIAHRTPSGMPLPTAYDGLNNTAEKLGKWCGATQFNEIARMLEVEF